MDPNKNNMKVSTMRTHDRSEQRRRIRKQIGGTLRRTRLEQRLTLKDLEQTLGVPKTQLSEHERGIWPIQAEDLYLWCEILGIEPGEVYPGLDEPLDRPANPDC